MASFSSSAVAAFARNKSKAAGPIGKLTQPPADQGCVSLTGAGPCVQGKALRDAFAVAVSQDGKSVYVAGAESDAVAALARDPQTSILHPLAGADACISEDGSNGDCRDGIGLGRPVGLAVSRDGNHVYATAGDSTSIAVLARSKHGPAPIGALSALACLSTTDAECTEQPLLSAAIGVKTSPDGHHVYVVAQGSSALLAFTRNARTGALTPLPGLDGCASPDGSGGLCRQVRGLLGARALDVSRDGRNLYVASEFTNTVAVFARDRKTGGLTQLPGLDGCVTDGGIAGICAAGKALRSPRGVAVSRDGHHVYVAASGSDAVAVFQRDTATGKLTQLPGSDGCVSETGSGGMCADGKALKSAGAVAVSNDGKSVYVASFGSNAVAVFSRLSR